MISDKPQNTLPHRDPFVWVHRLMERDAQNGTWGVAEYDVSPGLEVFRGHFPGRPIFPGVLQLEAAAQTCMWAHLGENLNGAPSPEVRFAGIEDFKFRRPVVPPSTLVIRVEQVKSRSGLQLWKVEIREKNQPDSITASGNFWLKLF